MHPAAVCMYFMQMRLHSDSTKDFMAFANIYLQAEIIHVQQKTNCLEFKTMHDDSTASRIANSNDC